MFATFVTIRDAGVSVEALKHHMAVQARDIDMSYLIVLKMGILFQTGDIDKAIRQGAAEVRMVSS